MQLTNIARDVKEDLDMGRIYLPQDEIERFGYSEEELKVGMVNQQFVELMRFQATRAKEYFQSGFQLLPYLSHRSRACPAVLGGLYCKVLDRIESHGYDVFNYRASLTTWGKASPPGPSMAGQLSTRCFTNTKNAMTFASPAPCNNPIPGLHRNPNR